MSSTAFSWLLWECLYSSQKDESLHTFSCPYLPGGPPDIGKDDELQADEIPRQVTSHGAAEYVSYPNREVRIMLVIQTEKPLFIRRQKLDCHLTVQTWALLTQQCRKSWTLFLICTAQVRYNWHIDVPGLVFICEGTARRNSGLDVCSVVETYVVMTCLVWVTGQKLCQENLQTDVAT